MSDIPVDKAAQGGATTVEVEREITKRAIVESVTSIVLVLLYMAWAFLRDRDPGVVAVGGAASDDWS